MYCLKCGKLNKEEAGFCAFCGEKIFHEKIKLTKKIGIVGLIIVGFILFLIFGPFAHNRLPSVKSSPSAVVKKYIEAFEKGEYSKVKGYISPQALLQEPSFTIENLNEAREELIDKGGVKKIEITKENIEGETAEVYFKIEFGDNSTDGGCVFLTKEEGAWKLENDDCPSSDTDTYDKKPPEDKPEDKDARIQADLSQFRAIAEIINSDYNSYATICAAGTLNEGAPSPYGSQLAAIETDIKAQQGGVLSINCQASVNSYCIDVNLITPGVGRYCIDDEGNAVITAESFSCTTADTTCQ